MKSLALQQQCCAYFYPTQWHYMEDEEQTAKRLLPVIQVIFTFPRSGQRWRVFSSFAVLFHKSLLYSGLLQFAPEGPLGASLRVLLQSEGQSDVTGGSRHSRRERLGFRTLTSFTRWNRYGRSLTRAFISCSSLTYSLVFCRSASLHVIKHSV